MRVKVNIRARKNGTYQLDYVNPYGIRRRPVVGNSYKVAEMLALKYAALLAEGKDPEEVKAEQQRRHCTLADLYDRFISFKRGRVGRRTMDSYANSWQHVKRYDEVAEVPIGTIRVTLVEQYCHTRMLAGASASTVHTEGMLISAMLRFAQRDRLIDAYPLEGIVWPKVRNKRDPETSFEQFCRLVAAMPVRVYQLILLAAYYSGKRREELFGLQIQDVRFLDVGGVEYSVRVKGGEFVTSYGTELLADVFREAAGERDNGEVFLSPKTGKRFPQRCSMTWFRAGVRKMGFKTRQGERLTDFRFHDIRHLSAEHLEQAGAQPRDIQAHLGHSNFTTTERYLSGHRRVSVELRRAE